MASTAVATANYFPESSLNQREEKFYQLSPVTESEMKGFTGKIAWKSCHFDPGQFPPQNHSDKLLPVITNITNLSISEVCFSSTSSKEG